MYWSILGTRPCLDRVVLRKFVSLQPRIHSPEFVSGLSKVWQVHEPLFQSLRERRSNAKIPRIFFFQTVNFKFQYSSNGNGGWKFDCQHGPNECKGNLYQACLLNALQGQEELQLEVLNCIMSDYQPHLATKKVKLIVFFTHFEFLPSCPFSAWKN